MCKIQVLLMCMLFSLLSACKQSDKAFLDSFRADFPEGCIESNPDLFDEVKPKFCSCLAEKIIASTDLNDLRRMTEALEPTDREMNDFKRYGGQCAAELGIPTRN